MIDCLSSYVEEWEKDLNIPLMTKADDDSLVEYVADAWESLQVVKYIQFLGYDLETRESKIDINHHIFRRQKKVPKKDKHKLKMIDDTRCHLFTAHIKISLEELDPKTQKLVLREKYINKDMLIPFADEDGIYFINGKKYYIIYQLTEKSTYNTLDSNVLKSLMPMIVRRDSIQRDATNGESYILPVYSTFVYKRKNPILLYMFANEGVSIALHELQVSGALKLVDDDLGDPTCLYFQLSSKCYIEVNKELFLNYSYLKSVVGGLYETLSNRFDLTMMDDRELFIKKLTPSNTIEKGMDNLTSFNRMMDKTTQKVLQLDIFHKRDVYAVLRWIMFEFDELRMKDNMDLRNKRLRCNEYVASLLTHEFSNKLNRVINMGSKVTMETIVDIFKFPGDILLQKMHSSGILRFDETINDMTFFSKFKWTMKGPHSLGGKNENNIMTKYRGCHPSFIGVLDLLTCGNSDPGTSGILSPFCKTNGLSFEEKGEPDEFLFNFMRDVKRILSQKGIETLEMEFDTPEDYYKILDYATRFSAENISVYGVSKNDTVLTFIKEEDMIAEHLREEEDEEVDDGTLEVLDPEDVEV